MPQQEMKRQTNAGDMALFTRSGDYVTTVRLPPFEPPAEAIQWGSRIFILTNGAYKEGILWVSFEKPR